MRAVVITRHGPPEVLEVEERPEPVAGPGEVRIEVKAAGINFADLMARTGMYPDAPKPPCVVGYEVAGLVESVGPGVERYSVGDRVVAGTVFGGYSEIVTAVEANVIPLPERLSFEQGAAVPVNYATAWAGLIMMGGLRAGDRVLIQAAAGGVGIAATQIARKVGAEIFGTASPGKHDAIRAQGVDHPIDYRSQDFEAAVRDLTGGEGIDVAFDAIGPSSFRKDYRLLRPGGRLVCFGLAEVQTGEGRNLPGMVKGLASMTTATMPWWKSLAMMNENKGVFGLNMLAWWKTEGDLHRAIEPLSAELESGALEPVVAESFPFERAADAHRFLHERRNIGKVVLTS
jgi:NADPH:quinone reductase-like Zn-dependent oxidoreductase